MERGLGVPMPSVTPQPEEYDVRSGLGRKDATPLRWRPLPSTPACATPMPLPHAHSRVLFTLQAPLRIPGGSQALAKTPPPTPPGAEVTAGPARGGTWGFSTDHTAPRRSSPPRERHLPGLTAAGPAGRALRGPVRWRPRAAGACPATGGMTPISLKLDPAAPARPSILMTTHSAHFPCSYYLKESKGSRRWLLFLEGESQVRMRWGRRRVPLALDPEVVICARRRLVLLQPGELRLPI